MNKKRQDNLEDAIVIDSIKAREIVQEILKFGVNQHQIQKIIKFLALELEDRELMVGICSLFDNDSEESPKIEI